MWLIVCSQPGQQFFFLFWRFFTPVLADGFRWYLIIIIVIIIIIII